MTMEWAKGNPEKIKTSQKVFKKILKNRKNQADHDHKSFF